MGFSAAAPKDGPHPRQVAAAEVQQADLATPPRMFGHPRSKRRGWAVNQSAVLHPVVVDHRTIGLPLPLEQVHVHDHTLAVLGSGTAAGHGSATPFVTVAACYWGH